MGRSNLWVPRTPFTREDSRGRLVAGPQPSHRPGSRVPRLKSVHEARLRPRAVHHKPRVRCSHASKCSYKIRWCLVRNAPCRVLWPPSRTFKDGWCVSGGDKAVVAPSCGWRGRCRGRSRPGATNGTHAVCAVAPAGRVSAWQQAGQHTKLLGSAQGWDRGPEGVRLGDCLGREMTVCLEVDTALNGCHGRFGGGRAVCGCLPVVPPLARHKCATVAYR